MLDKKDVSKLASLLERTEEKYAEHLGYEGIVMSQLQMFFAAMLRWNPQMPETIQLAIKIHDHLLTLVKPYIDIALLTKLREVDSKYEGKEDDLDALRNRLLDRVAVFLEFWDSKGMLLTRLPTDDLVEVGWIEIDKDGQRQVEKEKGLNTKPGKGRPSTKELVERTGKKGWLNAIQT